MVWPPPVLPITRTNSDPQQDTHPADHNALALAMNDTTDKLRLADTGVTLIRNTFGTPAAIGWQQMSYNTSAQRRGTIVDNNVVITIPVTGLWRVEGYMEFAVPTIANIGDLVASSLAIDSVRQNIGGQSHLLHGDTRPMLSWSGVYGFTAGQNVGSFIYCNTAGQQFTYGRLSCYLHSPGSIA